MAAKSNGRLVLQSQRESERERGEEEERVGPSESSESSGSSDLIESIESNESRARESTFRDQTCPRANSVSTVLFELPSSFCILTAASDRRT